MKTPAQIRTELAAHFDRDTKRRWWTTEELTERLGLGENMRRPVGLICRALGRRGVLESEKIKVGRGDMVAWRRVE